MSLSQLERFHATVNHEELERPLFYAGFTPDLKRRLQSHEGLGEDAHLQKHFGMYTPVTTNMKRPEDYPYPDFTGYFEGVPQPEGSYFDPNGCLRVPGSEYHFTHYIAPLRNAQAFSDLESYPWPDYARFETAHIKQAVEDAHAKGLVARVPCTHMYEEAWQVRGYEEFLMDMLAEPEWAHFILDKFMERNKRIAIAAAEAGADVLRSGDDVANQNALMFSVEHWREFIKEKWAEVYAAARAIKPDIQIWYHSDGNITDIIPELIETGVTILNPLQPECVDVEEVKRLYGDRIVIDGTIGTQTTMPFGSPDDIRDCVKKRMETLGPGGGLVLAPTHILEPEVPIENILAFVDACR